MSDGKLEARVGELEVLLKTLLANTCVCSSCAVRAKERAQAAIYARVREIAMMTPADAIAAMRALGDGQRGAVVRGMNAERLVAAVLDAPAEDRKWISAMRTDSDFAIRLEIAERERAGTLPHWVFIRSAPRRDGPVRIGEDRVDVSKDAAEAMRAAGLQIEEGVFGFYWARPAIGGGELRLTSEQWALVKQHDAKLVALIANNYLEVIEGSIEDDRGIALAELTQAREYSGPMFTGSTPAIIQP